MKAKKRQKLCYSCEGEVDLDVIVCPFCAADLREEKPEQNFPRVQQTFKNMDTEAALYPPPYAPRVRLEEAAPVAPEPAIQQEEESQEESRGSYGPIILLTLGAQLFLLGVFMLLFSTNGTFVLKWDARFWYFYLLTSIPLLIFGFRSLKK